MCRYILPIWRTVDMPVQRVRDLNNKGRENSLFFQIRDQSSEYRAGENGNPSSAGLE